ncbi:MAG: hypothetical protein K2X29_11305, partial [Candidatus Obscuribacterales bacterium]|nr:hypothetical protein [Candidatus Obscuribacterales bacterium]
MNATKQNNTQNNDDQFFDSLLQQLKLVIDNELLLSRTSLLVNSLESIFKEFNTTLDRRPKTIDFHILYREQMASIFSACQTKTSNSYYSSTREELRSLRELRCTETTLQLAIRLLKDASLMLADKHVNFDILRMLFKLDLDFHGFFNQKQCPQATSIWDELQTAKIQRLELIVNLFDSERISLSPLTAEHGRERAR